MMGWIMIGVNQHLEGIRARAVTVVEYIHEKIIVYAFETEMVRACIQM